MPQSYTFSFYVNDMTCGSCSGIVQNIVTDELARQGFTVKNFHVDFTTKDPKKVLIGISKTQKDQEEQKKSILQTVWDIIKKYIPSFFSKEHIVQADQEQKELTEQELWEKIKTFIDSSGFACENQDYSPDTEASTSAQQQSELSTLEKIIASTKKFFSSHWFLGALGCIAGIVVLITCMTGGLSLAAMISLAGLSTILTLILGANSYYDAWSKWSKSYSLTMDSLFVLSTAAILLVSTAALFIPWLPMMFDAALLIYGFRHIGIAIEDTIKEKIGTKKFQDRAPKTISVQTQNGSIIKPLSEIQPGDLIEVHAKEMIPLDGICVSEEGSIIYNTISTGAYLPKYFAPNEKVLAGMMLAENSKPLKMRVTKNHQKSHLARLDKRIENAVLDKSPIEVNTSKILNYFIPAVIIFAAISGIAIGLFFNPALAIQTAASILVSACPCTLGLITPLAVKTGMHKAAENNVVFKSAKTLQQAEQIDTVIFDLNGTLTTGVPKVSHFKISPQSGLLPSEFFSICAALEKKSAHPIGKAIHSYTNIKSDHSELLEVTELDGSHHAGITGKINATTYTIGSPTLMQQKGIIPPPSLALPTLEAGDHLVFVAREHSVIGYMVMTDPLREDAFRTINALTAMGKEVHLCTGADRQTAERYAHFLGIKNIRAECTSTQKTEYIKSLRKKGRKIAMIGDAANDTNAIAASDFSIAIASWGSDKMAREKAGAVIYKDSLMPVASAFAISQQTVSNIRQNLVMSFIYNFGSILLSGGLLLAAGFTLNPAVGVTLMIVQACLILLNVYRFKEQSIPHLQQETQDYIKQSNGASYNKMKKHMPTCEIENNCEICPTPTIKPNSLWTSPPELGSNPYLQGNTPVTGKYM